MRRLVKPLVFLLGFSVFCACTTTRMSRVEDLKPSDTPRRLQVTLIDGTQLRLRSTTITDSDLRGLIARPDTLLVSGKLKTDIRIDCLLNPGSDAHSCKIVIPRSDAALIHFKEPDRLAAGIGISLTLAAIISLVVYLQKHPMSFCC